MGTAKRERHDLSNLLSRQGHRLLQVGVALLLFTSLEGFAIPYSTAPGAGRSVHSLSGLTAVLLLAFGLVWPQLDLALMAARIAFWFLLYSALAIVVAFLLAAVWGAGNATMPLAGPGRGNAFRETVIMIVAYSSAPTGLIAFALILWGLRTTPERS